MLFGGHTPVPESSSPTKTSAKRFVQYHLVHINCNFGDPIDEARFRKEVDPRLRLFSPPGFDDTLDVFSSEFDDFIGSLNRIFQIQRQSFGSHEAGVASC